MKTATLAKKFELYLKLNGGLSKQDITVTDCRNCILLRVCVPEHRRYAFIKIVEGEPPKIIGYGNDFGMKDYEEEDGKIVFRVLKACMEWLDPDPRIFDK